jgi:hypothetical protein
MSSATTKSWTVKDVTVSVTKKSGGTAGEKLIAFLEWLGEQKPVDPGYGQGGGGRPDQGLPGQGGRPDNTLPGQGGGSGGRPDQGLPGKPPGEATQPRPDQGLPGKPPGQAQQPHPDQGLPGASGGQPDNSLPEFIGDNAEEIAKAVLGKCFDCTDGAQPKK